MRRERWYTAFAIALIILSAPAFTLAAHGTYWQVEEQEPQKGGYSVTGPSQQSIRQELEETYSKMFGFQQQSFENFLAAQEETRAFGKVQAGFASSGTNLQMTDAAFSPEAAGMAGPPPAEIAPLGSALPPEAASGFGQSTPTLNPTGTPGVFSLGGITIDTRQTVPLSGQGPGLMNEHHLRNFAASPPGGDFINNLINNLMSLGRSGSNGDDLVLAALVRAQMNLQAGKFNQGQIDESIAILAAQLKELKKEIEATEREQRCGDGGTGGSSGSGGVGIDD